MSDIREESGMFSLKDIIQSFRYWPSIMRLLWDTNAKALVAIIVLNVFRGISPIIVLLLMQNLINQLTVSQNKGFEVILRSFILLVGFTFLSEVLNLLQSYISKLFETLLVNRVNRLIMEKSVKMSLKDFENPKVQDTLKMAQSDAGHRPYQILQQILSLISCGVTLVSAVGMLISFKWWIVFLLLIMPMTSFYSYLKIGQQEFMIQYKRVPKMRRAWYYSFLMTNDRNFKEIKLYQIGNYLVKKYNDLFVEFYHEDRKMMRKRLRTSLFFEVINQGAYIVMMLIVFQAAFNGEIPIGNVVALTQTVVMTQSNTQLLISGLLALCQHNLYLKQLFAFLDFKLVNEDEKQWKDVPTIKSIEFKNVSFRYPDNSHNSLQDVNFKINCGQTIAIVGRNGSGKTTLMKLLTQLYDDFEGDILINGISIRLFQPEMLREHMGVVFQDFVQYELDVRHNIGFGNLSRLDSDKDLMEAAESAGIDSLVEHLPEKLDTQLGRLFDQGHQLSGGQWQRVSIARSFMRKADLYVLDEPSSMLDPESELQVFEKFRKLIIGRIGIFISHRYTAIKYANHILMMDGGAVVEQGSHEELMKKDGMYAYLYNMQIAAYSQDQVKESEDGLEDDNG